MNILMPHTAERPASIWKIVWIAPLGVLLVVVSHVWNLIIAELVHNDLFDGSPYCPTPPDDVEVTGGGVFVDTFPPSIICGLDDVNSGWEEEVVTQNLGVTALYWIGCVLICVGIVVLVASVYRLLRARRQTANTDHSAATV